ncbi:uncharacterized protein LOC122019267 [Zingiber officinale]|uniref:uncharacterized protein LOC122019267 n=1 Tax=Zingiber officinale TaxID=94328 RepID=UPI001C4ACDE6|nr:uncharacterized protein LOC122019267 [Zingiber officinale]
MGDDDDVEELENESEAVRKEPTIEKPAPVSAPPKDAERQLSKKELKKKEMAELDALLHEMGIANKDSNTAQNETAMLKTTSKVYLPCYDFRRTWFRESPKFPFSTKNAGNDLEPKSSVEELDNRVLELGFRGSQLPIMPLSFSISTIIYSAFILIQLKLGR